MAFEMHCHDGVPLLLGHRSEHAITIDAGVIQHDVQIPITLNGLLNSIEAIVVIGDIATVNNGFAASGDDVVHH